MMTAQLLNQAGGAIVVESGATLTVEGDLQNEAASAVNNSGRLVLKGNFTNAGTLNSNATQSTIAFRGSNPTSFSVGGPVNIKHLENRKIDADVDLLGEFTVTGSIDLASAKNSLLLVGDSDLRLEAQVPVTGASSNRYIATNGTGFLVREIDAAGSVEFPVGSVSGFSELRSDLTGSTFTNASVRVRALDEAAPDLPAGSADYIARHWEIVAENITDYSNTISADYLPADVVGSETFIVGASYADGTWSYAGAGRTAQTLVGTVSAGNAVFSGFGSSPLPVELISFAARRTANSTVALTWQTASERGTDHFAVERSHDAMTWIRIGTRDAARDSDQTRAYDFVDAATIALHGQVYYRLRINDVDGSYEYSDVRAISDADSKAVVSFFPNPTSDVLRVTTQEEVVSLRVFDQTGRKVRAVRAAEVRLGDLPSGMYRVELTTAGAQYNEAVVVQ